jgi:biotin transport system substrate-specific component
MRFLVLAAFVTAITAIGALTSFTIPGLSIVPFSLQVLGVYLAGGLLPPRWAFMSMTAYLLLGALGLPVFAEGTHGLGILLGPFGGYLWAYPIAAWIMALIARASLSRPRLGAGLLANILIIYGGGMLGLMLETGATPMRALIEGVLPFIGWDVLKAVIALPIIRRAKAFTIERWGAASYRHTS